MRLCLRGSAPCTVNSYLDSPWGTQMAPLPGGGLRPFVNLANSHFVPGRVAQNSPNFTFCFHTLPWLQGDLVPAGVCTTRSRYGGDLGWDKSPGIPRHSQAESGPSWATRALLRVINTHDSQFIQHRKTLRVPAALYESFYKSEVVRDNSKCLLPFPYKRQQSEL